jgi:hypothetical protein
MVRLFIKCNIASHAAIYQALAGKSAIADSINHR